MGEDKLKALLQESLAVATRTDAMKPSDLARVVIDTTVQPKAVMFPTDAKLLNRARERLVRLTKKLGVSLRQSYAPVDKLALIKHQRYVGELGWRIVMEGGDQMPVLFRQVQLVEMTEVVPVRWADDNHPRRIRFAHGVEELRENALPLIIRQLADRLF